MEIGQSRLYMTVFPECGKPFYSKPIVSSWHAQN